MADTECEPWHWLQSLSSTLTYFFFLFMLFTLVSFKFPDDKAEVLYIIIFIKALSLETQ